MDGLGEDGGTFWMIISAFGIAITTFTGQNFGAGKFDRMKKSVRVCLAMAMGTTVIVSGILLLFGPYVFRLFSNEEAVVLQGMEILRTLAPFFFTYICIEIFSGAVRGVGDTALPTLMTLVGICLLRTVWLLVIAPAQNSVPFTLYCYPITWSITSVLFVLYYLRGGWLKRSIKKTGVNLSDEKA